MRKIWFLLAVVVLAIGALLAAACGDDDDHAVDPTLSAYTTFNIIANDELSFTPTTLSVRVGQPVRLVVDNSGNTALHDWTIEEIKVDGVTAEGGSDDAGHDAHGSGPDLHVAVDGGESATIEFTPLDEGTYEFLCTVTGHAEGGMTGTLTVGE